MAVLTTNIQRPHKGHDPRHDVELPVAGYTNFAGGSTAHTIFKGSLVVCDVNDTDGYFRACPATGSTALTASDVFGGLALEKVIIDGNILADGRVFVRVARDGIWGFPKNSLAVTDVGAAIYAADDGATVTTTSTDNLWIGYLVDVGSEYAWVDIGKAAGCLNAAT